jgi:hypothetical protein
VLTSSRAGAGASVRLVGAAFTLLATTGPKEGLLAVYVDGRHVRDVSLYSKATHLDVGIVLTRFHKAGAHRITVVVKGKRAPHSKGTAVVVDGLQVL